MRSYFRHDQFIRHTNGPKKTRQGASKNSKIKKGKKKYRGQGRHT